MAFKPIEILINAKDNASGVFSSLQAKIAAAGAAVAGYFGIKAFVGVVQGAADLEAALSRVQAATGASGEEMQRLSKAAQDAGANTKFTSVEAAGALENLAKAGLSAADSIAALPAVLNLAQAGDVGLGEASEYVTKAVMGMGLAFTDAARVADVLALGANATNTSVSGLAQALSYAAPIAQSAGVSLEGTVAIMGKLADAGIDASRSGTAMANMLAQFSDPASQFKRALAEAGITTNDFEKALHQLAAAGPKGEKAILAVGLNAGPALRALLNQGMGALDELKGKLQGAAGSAAETARIMGDNLEGSFKGLQSAWQAVKDTLGTPVLPVLKEGVDQLANAFRGFVADGTIGRFGAIIAEGARNAVQGLREFIGTLNPQEIIAKFQEWVTSASNAFAQIAKYATESGRTVALAWNTMATGSNVVLSAVYKVGESFLGVTRDILTAMAWMSEKLQKIAIGDAGDRLKAEAAQLRGAAEALTAVVDALHVKASESFDAAFDSARAARESFVSLTGAVDESVQSATAAGAALAKTTAELDAVAEASIKAANAVSAKEQADQAAKQAAAENAAAVAELRGEYAAFIASGNLQAAAQKLEEINARLRDTSGATASAKDAVKAVQRAYQTLGVTSSETLKNTANEFKAAYDTIRASGTATAQDLAAAFQKSAQAAIDANNGIAPAWVQSEAALRGYVITTDNAGKSVLQLRDAVTAAAAASAGASGEMQGHWQGVRQSVDAATNSLGRYAAKQEQLAEGVTRLGAGYMNKDGMASDAKGNVQQAYVWTRATVIDFLKQAGLDEQLAQDASKQFLDANGKVIHMNNPGQAKWGGKYGSLSTALANVADYYKNTDNGKFEAAQRMQYLQQVEAFNQMIQLLHSQRQPAPPTAAPTAAPTWGSNKGSSSGTSSGITINVNGINDPVALARKLEPELRRLGALAR